MGAELVDPFRVIRKSCVSVFLTWVSVLFRLDVVLSALAIINWQQKITHDTNSSVRQNK
jgi:hypothetical protein